MPRAIKGRLPDIGFAIQQGYSLTEKNDGTIDGTVTFKTDDTRIASVPRIGSTHPRDPRCECYTSEPTWHANGEVTIVNSYFGLQSRKTDPIISYTPNTNTDDIRSHPDFAELAGTADAPNEDNKATWNPETGEFLGFFGGELLGVEFYLVPASLLSLSYWTDSVPSLKKRMTIQVDVAGFKKPADVKELMLLDTPYRQVGSFYQVTEQWMGSGPKGFSRKVYPQD